MPRIELTVFSEECLARELAEALVCYLEDRFNLAGVRADACVCPPPAVGPATWRVVLPFDCFALHAVAGAFVSGWEQRAQAGGAGDLRSEISELNPEP